MHFILTVIALTRQLNFYHSKKSLVYASHTDKFKFFSAIFVDLYIFILLLFYKKSCPLNCKIKIHYAQQLLLPKFLNLLFLNSYSIKMSLYLLHDLYFKSWKFTYSLYLMLGFRDANTCKNINVSSFLFMIVV